MILKYFILATLFQTLVAPALAAGPSIVIDPDIPTFTVDPSAPKDGRVQVLSCSTSGDKPAMFSQLQWAGPNTMDNFEALKKKHRVTEESTNSNIWELQFINPTLDDKGVYYCFGTYSSSDKIVKSINVSVIDPLRVVYCPERQYIVEGSTKSKITCRFSGGPNRISILKDGEPMQNTNSRYKWDNADAIEFLGPIEKSDAGVYTFVGKSQGTKLSVHVRVEVHTKPTVQPFNGTLGGDIIYAVEDQPAYLQCKASGYPQPLVGWLDPKLRNLTQIGGYVVNQEKGLLTIEKAKRFNDNGTFECRAWTNHETAVAKISLVVDLRPQINSFFNQTANENDIATLECRASGDPLPQISIRRSGLNQEPYRRGDGFVIDEETIAEGGGKVETNVYRVKLTASKALSGIHYCNATNRAGSAEKLNYLTVNYKPDLRLTPPEQFFRSGAKFTLRCVVESVPEPTITWWADNLQITNVSDIVQKSADGKVYTSFMTPSDRFQNTISSFHCRASNNLGFAEKVIQARYKTVPGALEISVRDRLPTSVKLYVTVPRDGGDQVKRYRYSYSGRTLDIHNPNFNYRPDERNDTFTEALSILIIKNLLPNYQYHLKINAINDVGDGEISEISFHTSRPSKPERPVIITSISHHPHHQTSPITSDYQNGYLLRWSPPDSDNGDQIQKYVITFNKISIDPLNMNQDDGELRIIEQMNEKSLSARIGPLEVNRRYKITLRARNSFGDSDPDAILIQTISDRPAMVEYEPQPLSWLTEPTTNTLIIMLALGFLLLVAIDLIFCFCFEIGITHQLKSAASAKASIA